MSEPTGHCPYLGLKQNRAIRFASPTLEHRCYVSGEPLEIPVDQSTYCLSQGHVHCPLYMGLTVPTMSETPAAASGALLAPAGGVRGWLMTLSPRDRAIYGIMIAMLAIIVAIYLFVGLQTFFRPGDALNANTPTTSVPATAQPIAGLTTAIATATNAPVPTDMSTPTDLPTSVPSATPPATATDAPIILAPTAQPTLPPTATSAQAVGIATSTAVPPAATSQAVATSVPRPTSAPKPPLPPTTRPEPSARPQATAQPQPTARPQPPAPATAIPAPPATTSAQVMTLYFADTTGSVLVPVRRNVGVAEKRIAEAAIRDLIAGPRNGLKRLLAADTQLLGITLNGNRATVNFDRDPTSGDDRGFDSIVLTLTELPGSIRQVQFQINGRNSGGVRERPILNPVNPSNLAVNTSTTEFLPLYFPSVDGRHDIRVIRMIPKTKQVGEATVRALLEGPPAEYAGALRQVIPAGTELRGITINKGVVLVDFTQPFANAPDVDAAMRSVIESLTTIKTVSGVQFLVEGQAFADGQIFRRPAINQE